MMLEWLTRIDAGSAPLVATVMVLGVLLLLALASWLAWRRGVASEAQRHQPEVDALRSRLAGKEAELGAALREQAVVAARLQEQQQHFARERDNLEQAEKALKESFERLAGRIFEERAKSFNELSEKQLGGLLKPLAKDLEAFRSSVEATNKEGISRHAEMREKLQQLQALNQTLHQEASNLTRALTRDVKAQGNWGEQQLERLMELAGLRKGEHYYTQLSVKGKDGQTLQPDFVLQLPGNTSIILDSKVSLTDWTRYQAAEEDGPRAELLAAHVQSVRAQIINLGSKNYPQVEQLNALDFVLMFVPIESALIAALQTDATLPEFALKHKVALLSPANFLATVRTVAAVWQMHNQNTNAADIAERGGKLYDKFHGFVENLRQVGSRLDQATDSYNKAFRQLSEGPGNLVSQVQLLSDLGARHAKQMDQKLVGHAIETDTEAGHLRLIDALEDNEEAEG
jgi:DNA recombination protein RmuC